MFKNFKIVSKNIENAPYINIFVKGFEVTYRLFTVETALVKPRGFLDNSKLNSQENLKNKYFKLSKEESVYHKCTYDKTIKLDPKSWEPYKEIYLVGSHRNFKNDAAAFIDKYAETYISKANHNNWNKKNKIAGTFTLFRWIVLPDTNLETAPCFLSQDVNVITNLTFDKEFEYVPGEDAAIIYPWRDYYIPHISIDGPETIRANSTATFNISVTHHEGEPCLDSHTYYVDCIQGYAPNKEVKVVDGKGSLKVMALGLEPGDKLRFKINDRTWTGKAEKILDVV
jgi:hypothetical protein